MSRRIDVGEKYSYDLSTALAETPAWHTLYCPAEIRRYVPGGPNGFKIAQHGTTIGGDGKNSGEDAGLWPWAHPDVPNAMGTGDSTVVRIEANAVTIRDIAISNCRGFVKGVGDHISFSEAFTIGGPNLYEVAALYAGRHVLRLAPTQVEGTPANYCVSPRIRDCVFYGGGSHGVYLETVTDLLWDGSASVRNIGRGLYMKNCAGFKIHGNFESNDGGIVLEGCGPGSVSGWFEEFCDGGTRSQNDNVAPASLKEPALVLDNCRGVTVRASIFEDWTGKKPTAILLRNGTTGCVIEKSSHIGVQYSVDDGGCRGNTIFRQTSPAGWPTIPWRVNRERNTVIG